MFELNRFMRLVKFLLEGQSDDPDSISELEIVKLTLHGLKIDIFLM